MPLYDYQCTNCRHLFEDLAGVNESRRRCPECGEEAERQVAPRRLVLRTTTTYAAGLPMLGDQMPAQDVKRLIRQARRRGVSVSAHDFFDRGLASGPNDLEALVPASDPVGHVKRLCKKRNLACESRNGLSISRTPTGPPPQRINERLINEKMQAAIAQNPSLAEPKRRADLRENLKSKAAKVNYS